MDDLITWLRAQLDHREQLARKAHGAHWRAELREPMQHIITVGAGVVQDGVAMASGSPSVLPHIADNDPAFVLDEIEATRRIIDLVVGAYAGYAVLPLLALPYAGRPGYREEWRPA